MASPHEQIIQQSEALTIGEEIARQNLAILQNPPDTPCALALIDLQSARRTWQLQMQLDPVNADMLGRLYRQRGFNRDTYEVIDASTFDVTDIRHIFYAPNDVQIVEQYTASKPGSKANLESNGWQLFGVSVCRISDE